MATSNKRRQTHSEGHYICLICHHYIRPEKGEKMVNFQGGKAHKFGCPVYPGDKPQMAQARCALSKIKTVRRTDKKMPRKNKPTEEKKKEKPERDPHIRTLIKSHNTILISVPNDIRDKMGLIEMQSKKVKVKVEQTGKDVFTATLVNAPDRKSVKPKGAIEKGKIASKEKLEAEARAAMDNAETDEDKAARLKLEAEAKQVLEEGREGENTEQD